jgi:hypothetical protein
VWRCSPGPSFPARSPLRDSARAEVVARTDVA